MRLFLPPCVALLVASLPFSAHSLELSTQVECEKSALFLAPVDSPGFRKYAPDREVDILHLIIDVTPDFTNRTVSGTTTIRFKPIAKPIEKLSLDAVHLTVGSIESTEPLLDHQVTDDKIIIEFAQPVPADKEVTVAIQHSAEPAQGMYFRTPDMGYKEGDTHLFTQGETIDSRHWFPCFDSPNEKFTSETICHVPEGMIVLSNGRLVSQDKDPATGLVAFRWLQDKPHVNYLITLVAGYFKSIEDKYKDIPLAFYALPSDIDQAANSFKDTKDMMAFFEEEIGVPYPWAKYYQVTVNDFVAGGMENTSMTVLADRTLFTDATENIRSSQGLVAHELAHQWFGDLVTCKDWSHIWLNEGFATYYAALYEGHRNGRDAMLYQLYNQARRVLASTNTRPIVDRTYDSPGQMFGLLAYQKGSAVLHMLRAELGEELYRRCIKTYLERHEFDTVVTEDLNSVIEELSGRSYDRFFDQWVYHGGVPELEISYNWDARSRLARLTVRQTQRVTEQVPLFQFPVAVRFKGRNWSVDRQIVVRNRTEDFYFSLSEAPTIVRFDPDCVLLARVNFSLPTSMLHAQLQDSSDAMGRALAIEALSRRKDRETVEQLRRVLNNDAFYGARIEAARALGDMQTDQALEALVRSTRQSDARVRQQVYSAIASYYDTRAMEAQRAMLKSEKNPDIQAIAIRELGVYPASDSRELLLAQLNSRSYRNQLADAAIAAIRAQNDPWWIGPLLENLGKREADYTRAGYGQALRTLAQLAREQEDKSQVREFLLARLNHPGAIVQRAAIGALGVLGDPAALGPLEKIAAGRRDSPERAAADGAIRAIESARPSNDVVGRLREELLALRRENQELRREFEALQKKVEALTPAMENRRFVPVRSPKEASR
ncbi:MAG TPA: M1 family aminopeptidase [Verrucomicrobiota bacterium]|nr:M1 family aminopeptidase [Verrucomicrobiota bacterium]